MGPQTGTALPSRLKSGGPAWFIFSSGSASTVKEPGHFEVRKFSSQVTQMHFFPQKVDNLFYSCRSQNTVSPSK